MYSSPAAYALSVDWSVLTPVNTQGIESTCFVSSTFLNRSGIWNPSKPRVQMDLLLPQPPQPFPVPSLCPLPLSQNSVFEVSCLVLVSNNPKISFPASSRAVSRRQWSCIDLLRIDQVGGRKKKGNDVISRSTVVLKTLRSSCSKILKQMKLEVNVFLLEKYN